MRVAAIINPVSGAGMDPTAATRRATLIRDELTRRGLQPSIDVTLRAGHARELALKAVEARVDLLIVWGATGSETAIGIIPAGSGNGFAAALGIPRDPVQALAKALGPRVQAIDVGVIGERRFLNVAGIGIDARIAALFNQRARGSRGKWPYVTIGVTEGCRYKSREYIVTLNADPIRYRALLIAFANGREYGMGASLAPRAALDDGLLDAFIVEDRHLVSRFWDARHLARGTVDRAPRVVTAKVTSAVVESAEPLEYHVDGEPGTAIGRLEVGVLPGALLVRA